jgi:hypothetical protein
MSELKKRALDICNNLLQTLRKVRGRKTNPISMRAEFKPATMTADRILRKLSQVMDKHNITKKELGIKD